MLLNIVTALELQEMAVLNGRLGSDGRMRPRMPFPGYRVRPGMTLAYDMPKGTSGWSGPKTAWLGTD